MVDEEYLDADTIKRDEEARQLLNLRSSRMLPH